jgi:uncharacterized membrane protein (UPF0127 family)
MKCVQVRNLSNPLAIPLQLGICDSFISRLKGLMFSKDIDPNGGLFFLNPTEDRINSAIHMFFMNYNLLIIWVDSTGKVVDKIIASRWKTIAAPQRGAKFILETHPGRFLEYNSGDLLEFEYG